MSSATTYKEAEQTEKAYQKQDGVFIARKKAAASKMASKAKKGMRYYKSVGLGFKTPKEAIESNYVDKKCPFTGNVSIRGRILKGMVISNKMKRTIVVRRDYLGFVSKYRRFEKRHSNMSVHCSPCFIGVGEGDVVTIGQCRPLAKTVRFNVLNHEPSMNKSVSVKKMFRMF
jgi:small subunit ribosomal protein S11e